MVEKASPTRRILSIRAITSSFSFSCSHGLVFFLDIKLQSILVRDARENNLHFRAICSLYWPSLYFQKTNSSDLFWVSQNFRILQRWLRKQHDGALLDFLAAPSSRVSCLTFQKFAIISYQVHSIIQSRRRLNCLAPRTPGTRRSTLTKQVLLLQMSSKKFL